MEFRICNPKEDQYENRKENIFLAFDIEGNYMGSAYAYPAVNHHQLNETPYAIFIGVDAEDAEVKQELFDKVVLRAKELRMEKSDLKCRVYGGFEYNPEKLDFYIKNGFEEDYSIIMEADIPENFECRLPDNIRVTECNIHYEKEVNKYKTMYDEIFMTPLDLDALKEQGKQKYFKNLYFSIDNKLQGRCTIFEKDGFGYMETLYVLPEARGKGISKLMVDYIFDYFRSKGLYKTKLEVWQLNKRAVKLYESFGYKEVQKNLMFPGITL